MSADVQVKAFQEQLEALARQVEQLSNSDAGTEQFFRAFLEKTVAVLGVGGGVWTMGQAGELACLCHMNLAKANLDEQGKGHQLLTAALAKVKSTGGVVVLPGSGTSNLYDGGVAQQAGVNESPHTLLFVPVLAGKDVAAVLVLISPEEVDPRAVRGYAGYVAGLCERAGGFLLRRRLGDLEAQLGRTDRLREYVSSLHSSLDPRRVCYALANYGQEFLGVYRCMAGSVNVRGKFRMQAVSGLESVAAKSNFIRMISTVAQQVCRNGKALLVDNPEAANRPDADDADELLTAARIYMLQAGALVMGIFPIKAQDRVVGALIVEKATEEPIAPDQRQQIDGIVGQAAPALANSLAYRQLPLSPLVRLAAAVRERFYRSHWARRVVWLGVLTALVAVPLLVQKQVKVVGTAELIPAAARIAYAAHDGVIESVAIPDDGRVEAGQVLATLDTREIDSKIERVGSQIAEMELTYERASALRSAEADLLKLRLKALRAEKAMYDVEKSLHQITAPVAGTVITRQSVLEQLWSRPVGRGEGVLEIVPAQSAWQLNVHVPEDQAGDLLEAYDDPERTDPLVARIILKAYPDMILESQVLSVARRAFVESTGEQKYRNVIEVRVAEPAQLRQQGVDPRQGLEGKVAIHCGQRALVYVLTHRFINYVRVGLF